MFRLLIVLVSCNSLCLIAAVGCFTWYLSCEFAVFVVWFWLIVLSCCSIDLLCIWLLGGGRYCCCIWLVSFLDFGRVGVEFWFWCLLLMLSYSLVGCCLPMRLCMFDCLYGGLRPGLCVVLTLIWCCFCDFALEVLIYGGFDHDCGGWVANFLVSCGLL